MTTVRRPTVRGPGDETEVAGGAAGGVVDGGVTSSEDAKLVGARSPIAAMTEIHQSTMKDGVKCIVNTQRPTRQIWLAARARAWHFAYDEQRQQWLDDKGTGAELFSTVAHVLKEGSNVDVRF